MPVSFNLFVTAFHDLLLFFSIMYLLVLGYYNHVSLKFVIIIIIIIIITLTYQSITVVFQRHLIADVQLLDSEGCVIYHILYNKNKKLCHLILLFVISYYGQPY